MASTDSVPVNGNYAHQGYDAVANNAAGYASQPASTSQPSNNASADQIPKDEVGWYFVEQYYTTLSKTPDKLYLFYNKRSQFVSGTEEDKVNVCVGQKAINDRIKELDFHDTKVRVTNVDSQGSDANIVIQVIGEISNKGQPHKRFVQTFILAEQTNGYFVLNDIFRYLSEEPEEEEELQQELSTSAAGAQESAPAAVAPEGEEEKQNAEVPSSEENLAKVDNKLEEATKEEPADEKPVPAAVNGTAATEASEAVPTEDTSAAVEESSTEPEVPAQEEVAEPEKPKDPTPTPVPAAPKPAPVATPAAPPKPAAPRTWASLAASAHKVAMPAVPSSSQPAPSQAKAAATPAPSQPSAVPAQVSAPAREASPANSQSDASGWQSVGGHKKEQSRGQTQATSEADQKRAYIKNVYSQVEEGALRSAMSKFGEVEYLDISRGKNCAFVDFKTAAGFQAAVNANPHTVNGIEIKVEERRTRPPQPFFSRGGGAPRGRGGMGGSQRGNNFQRGGRGGSVRGRGGAQDA
ncbi:hypothetical protein DM02DRAFT_65262 [Periconia macrospinosa]|uniref:NTF2-domain-containing protein n=1 Tax=Periconia macrospinosa TaxID=97972 RepID=A0A2V1DI24_9PLEO|nr:hypothetical protein DM02DRAFT_65262 [Periconia macrospinosa]